MKATATRSRQRSADVVAEARRLLVGERLMLGDLLKERESLLRIQIQDRLYSLMLSVLWQSARHLVILGQSALVLDGKLGTAKATFAKLGQFMPYFDTAIESVLEDPDADRLDATQMLDPAVCFLLAGDRANLARLAKVKSELVFDLSPRWGLKPMRAWRDFTLNLLDVAAARLDQVKARGQSPIRRGDAIEGYDRVLLAIAARDRTRVEAGLQAVAAQYPMRAKRRRPSLDWQGEGKIAQAATFDALGTALCQLARWRGLKVAGDAALHPAGLMSPP